MLFLVFLPPFSLYVQNENENSKQKKKMYNGNCMKLISQRFWNATLPKSKHWNFSSFSPFFIFIYFLILFSFLFSLLTFLCSENGIEIEFLVGNYSCLKVNLIFTRDRSFYFTTFFIPGIILVTSSFITFWLEWNAVPARSMIGKHLTIHAHIYVCKKDVRTCCISKLLLLECSLRRYIGTKLDCKYFISSNTKLTYFLLSLRIVHKFMIYF